MGHFCDRSGDAFFSCKDFDASVAVDMVRRAFRPLHIETTSLARQAVQPSALLAPAAE